MRDKSCLPRAFCLAHLYKVYQFDNFDIHTMQYQFGEVKGFRPPGRPSSTFNDALLRL